MLPSALKTLLLTGFILLFTDSLPAQNSVYEQIDELGQKYVSKGRNKGLVIGIIDGEGVRIRGYGELSRENPVPPDENTLFEIGSLTNVFTATLMMYESMDGRFDLADPIQPFLPAGVKAPTFHNLKCAEITIPGLPGIDRPRRVISCIPDPLTEDICISFCDLASHTSGLPNTLPDFYFWNPFVQIKELRTPRRDYDKEEFYSRLNKYELSTRPGARFRYSNLGMALLGNLLSDIAGKPYEELLSTRITGPLGLTDTRITLSEEQLAGLAPGHNFKGRPAGHWRFQAMAPSCGLKSTAKDLLRFLQANLSAEQPVMRDVFEQTRQARVDVRFPKFSETTTAGYGWLITLLSEDSNLPANWHNGGTGGFRSFAGFVKDTGAAAVVLSNSANPVDDIGFEVLRLLNSPALLKTTLK